MLQLVTTLLAVGASVSVLPPVLRRVLPEKVVDLPVSKPLDAALAKAFPKVNLRCLRLYGVAGLSGVATAVEGVPVAQPSC